jgi:4-hydroxy-L-threonine phosphate dehydrogenase PdxA
MNKELPVLAITMGDPSGIGPEIIVKSLNEKSVYEICKPLVVGDADVMNSALKIADSSLKVRAVKNVDDAEFKYGVIDVIDLNCVDISELQHGKVQAVSGRAAYLAVEKAIQLALNNEVDGTITSPLNKEAMNKAGYHYSGHTEIYADLTNTKNYTMMLAWLKGFISFLNFVFTFV